MKLYAYKAVTCISITPESENEEPIMATYEAELPEGVTIEKDRFGESFFTINGVKAPAFLIGPDKVEIKAQPAIQFDVKKISRINTGECLKHQRVVFSDYSQNGLAKAAGISTKYLQHLEQGVKDVNGARLSTLLNLCDALQCNLFDILSDVDTLCIMRKTKLTQHD